MDVNFLVLINVGGGSKMVAKEDMELAPPINIPNMHLYLEQFILRDNWGLRNKWTAWAEQRRDHTENTGEMWKPTRNGGVSEHHCLHSPCSRKGQAGALPGALADLWGCSNMSAATPRGASSSRTTVHPSRCTHSPATPLPIPPNPELYSAGSKGCWGSPVPGLLGCSTGSKSRTTRKP